MHDDVGGGCDPSPELQVSKIQARKGVLERILVLGTLGQRLSYRTSPHLVTA